MVAPSLKNLQEGLKIVFRTLYLILPFKLS